MTSTISSAKTKNPLLGMMKWTIQKSIPVIIIYSFLLMIALPVFVILLKQNTHNFNYLEEQSFGLAGFVVMCFSIVIGVMMFSIYHNKRSVDLYASFPIKKHTLFLAKYFSGLIILVVPFVVSMILALLIGGQINSDTVFVTFFNMAGMILGIINIFSMIAFLAMICGSVVDTLVTFGVVNIGVVSCVFLGMIIISSVLPGYNHLSIDFFELPVLMSFFLLCPVSMPFMSASFLSLSYDWDYSSSVDSFINSDIMKTEIVYMVIWLLLSAIYVFVAIMIAKKRKNENVQNSFIYSFPKVVIQVLASLSVAMILGWIFAESFSYNSNGFKTMLMFMLGALIGSFAAFLIVTLIYNRGVKRFVRALPVFACSFIAVAVFYLVISLGLVGVSYVPKAEDVKSTAVYVNDDSYFGYDDVDVIVSKGNTLEKVDYFVDDKEFINSTVNLHQSIIDRLHDTMGTFFNFSGIFDVFYEEGYEPTSVKIVYELNNGKKVSRTFLSEHYVYDDIIKEYNEVVSSDIFKEYHKVAMCSTADEANVASMDIYPKNRYTKVKPMTEEEFTSMMESDPDYYFETMVDEYDYYSESEDNDKELDDTEFLNSIYSSLREEYLADDNVAETSKANTAEYVEPTDDNSAIYDEVEYSIGMSYSANLAGYEFDKKLAELGYDSDEFGEYTVNPYEVYMVTKENYPKTWELINSYFEEQENCTSLTVYPNS